MCAFSTARSELMIRFVSIVSLLIDQATCRYAQVFDLNAFPQHLSCFAIPILVSNI